MSRTNRKPYTGSKEFDKTCRCGGSCPHCRSNRKYKNNKKLTLEKSLKDYERNRD
tara:strand:+ start:1842 stop:2006 length:165 start_codon:yes stop_codon:yes gene_type:complete